LQGIQKAADLGVSRLILETDASSIVQAVKSMEIDRSTAGGLIWELKDLIASNFFSVDVNHIARSCNSVADMLAALGARLSSGADPILDSIPYCIRELVANDMAASYE
jgi:ribonuclease HI